MYKEFYTKKELNEKLQEEEDAKMQSMIYACLNFGLPKEMICEIFSTKDIKGNYVDWWLIESLCRAVEKYVHLKDKTDFDKWLEKEGYRKTKD